jgi:hypothetical protein
MQKQESLEYFYLYEPDTKEKYGLRYAIPEDAYRISELYIQEYGYNYVNPIIYDQHELEGHIADEDNIWIIGENLQKGELIAISLMELKENYAFSSKTIIRKSYRGKGLGSRFGFRSVKELHDSGVLDNRIKIDSDVRGVQVTAQKLSEKSRGLPYGFIPFYNNFGDKRNLNSDYYDPYPTQDEESAYLYFSPLPRLSKNRSNEVYLLDNELITFFYDYMKHIKRMTKNIMKRDTVYYTKFKQTPEYLEKEDISVSIDLYGSRVKLLGVTDYKVVEFLMDKFKNYRMLIWHIPATLKGVKSMQQVLDNGFIVCGYNLGGFKPRYSDVLVDSMIFVKYLHEKSKNSLKENISCTEMNEPILKHVIKQLS